MQNQFVLLALAIFLTACGGSESPPTEANVAEKNNAVVAESVHEAAVANSNRTEADRNRDAGRKPAAIMDFFSIQPGMTVLDMFSGGGYYTEMLSYVVGTEGKVVAHTNAAYAQFVGEEATQRYSNERLPNVEIMVAENNELQLPENTFDAVMMVLAYHDIYWVSPENGWPEIDSTKLLAELYRGLKPGGTLAIVDHYAAAGSLRDSGGTLHRIDPAIVRDEIEAAGFVFDSSSEILRNADDDLSLHMGDPAVRGKTDRFVFRFRKAE